VVLLDLTASPGILTAVVVTVIGGGAIFHGAQFVRAYFRDYPVVAAPYFQYGMQQAIAETRKITGEHRPVVITNRMEMPYIYVLFFESYVRLPQGVFVLPGSQISPAPPVKSILYPDGRTAYNILVK
jgi:hypothetical protein